VEIAPPVVFLIVSYVFGGVAARDTILGVLGFWSFLSTSNLYTLPLSYTSAMLSSKFFISTSYSLP
jgi:hypothetical protein